MLSPRGRIMDRRRFLTASLGALTLPGLMRLRAAEKQSERTAIILVWLRGGCSHLDTYDPKPEAGDEYRGPFKPLATRTPGLRLTELLPRQAALSHRFAVVRSLAHTGGGHPAGSLQVLTGDPDSADKPKAVHPDWMTVAHKLRGGAERLLPNYVGVNPISSYDGFGIAGPGWVGPGHEPFAVLGDPSAPGFRVPNVGSPSEERLATLRERVGLRAAFDGLKREADKVRDRYERQALDLLTSPAAARAFDLSKEPARVRERYGMNAWGQQLLMARRLVEAGVEIVTSTFDGPLCGRVANWDDHAVNHHIFDALKHRAPFFDAAVSALIEDVFDRGMDKRVMVIVTGEFGRTPRIERTASSGGGVA
ncbi:MAG: DUF1501 domain-containing protein, partial [Gemmataceae bacterium]|nr:DUF1501 domain-containing protein [Gemmataceae bacterium]